jgi:hypothetical protein
LIKVKQRCVSYYGLKLMNGKRAMTSIVVRYLELLYRHSFAETEEHHEISLGIVWDRDEIPSRYYHHASFLGVPFKLLK